METSLRAQNDLTLKKAKWLIVVGLAWYPLYHILYHFIPFPVDGIRYVLLDWNAYPVAVSVKQLIFALIGDYLGLSLCLVGYVKLIKHSLPTIQIFAKLLAIQTVFVMCLDLIENLLRIYPTWLLAVPLIGGYLFCMGLAALWKNDRIRKVHQNIIITLGVVAVIQCILSISGFVYDMVAYILGAETFSGLASDALLCLTYDMSYTNIILNIAINIALLCCFWRLLKTPSKIPTTEETNVAHYSYYPTKIEIGYIVSCIVFVGLTIFYPLLVELFFNW